MRRLRQGFSLLEVMVALAILVVSLAILMETMSSATVATRQAERIVTATQLAQQKLVEVQLYVEREGISEQQMTDRGDFRELGEARMNLEFGANLEEYRYEWWVSQIDIGLAGDIAGMAEDLSGAGALPGGDEGLEGIQSQAPDLGSLGIGSDMITQMLGRYIREMQVRVYWGEETGQEVVLTTHVSDPAGGFVNAPPEGVEP